MSQPQGKKQNIDNQRKGTMIYMYYQIDNGKLVRNLRKCPRCDVFMAHHKERERWACGSCGFTEYVSR